MARPDLSSCAMLFSRDITEVVFHSNRIVFPRRSPARTNAPAGAKTGQTQHHAGAQFTSLQFELRHLRVSAENGGISRKLRKTHLPKARALRGGFLFIYTPFAAPKAAAKAPLQRQQIRLVALGDELDAAVLCLVHLAGQHVFDARPVGAHAHAPALRAEV